MIAALERRDWFVEAQARRRKAMGLTVSTEALQRQSAEDLRLVDQARASGDLKVSRDSKADRDASIKRTAIRTGVSPAQVEAAKIGATAYVRPLPSQSVVRKPAALTGVAAQKHIAMEARIRLVGKALCQLREHQARARCH